jgi:lipopolysaccharide export system protein LptA
LHCDWRPGAITVSFGPSNAQKEESYLFDGNVEFVTGCLLLHALAVVVVDGSKADGDAVVVSTEGPVEDEDGVATDRPDDVSGDAELEIGDTVR